MAVLEIVTDVFAPTQVFWLERNTVNQKIIFITLQIRKAILFRNQTLFPW
jgi:hypothetical protein